MTLQCQPGRIELCISDNGRGFRLDRVEPDSLGLSIMRERSEVIGARLKVESQIDRGTEVVVVWQAKKGMKDA